MLQFFISLICVIGTDVLILTPVVFEWKVGGYAATPIGRLRTVFMKLYWADTSGAGWPAMESVRLPAEVGHRYASPADDNNWRGASSWLQGLSDIVARRL